MKRTISRSLLTTAVVLIVFLWSALLASPVLADGGETPPSPTVMPPDATPLPTETAVPVSIEVTTTPIAVDPVASDTPAEAVVTETPLADPSLPAETPTSSDGNVLSQVPDDTQVVVTDENGNALPLASTDAAETVASGDPIWCPAGVLVPVSGKSGCSPSQTSLTDLIAWLTANNPGAAGTIWIEKTYNSATAVGDGTATGFTLDGLVLTNMANYALTVKGGWNGPGTGTIDTATPSTLNGDSLSIINWKGDVTLNDLVITNVPVGSPALTVTTTKKVMMNRVKVKENKGSGAKIDNTASGSGTGDVTITLSQFLKNAGGTGLDVDSRGAITLSGVLADENGGDGANLDNSTAAIARNVTINTGVNEFDKNGGYGLYVASKGAVILKDITANNNSTGAWVDNSAGIAQPVTLSGINIFSDNRSDGLVILSKGAISASSLVAYNNASWGAKFDNSDATTAQPVNITGKNEFKYNGDGLWIDSQGSITISNLTVLTDPVLKPGKGIGVYLNNKNDFASNVTMTGTNVITNNYNSGLEIYSKGIITLYNVTANNNGISGSNGYGAILDNSYATSPMAVVLIGTNSFSNNYSGGLKITSKGAITLYNITANGSTNGIGAQLDNQTSGSSALPQNVTINGTNSFSGNSKDGLVVLTYGTISLNNVTASNNTGGYGATLRNCREYYDYKVSKMLCESSSIPKAVTLSGTNHFDGNLSGGLSILTKGAITLTNITADNNRNNLLPSPGTPTAGGFGTNLDNRTYGDPDLPQNVTINGINSFSGNYLYGLQVSTYGTVLVNNVTVNGNNYDAVNGYGALIQNDTASSPKPVTITGYGNFNNNKTYGLHILTGGAITLTNVSANNNAGGIGAELDNQKIFIGLLPQNVTINGTNSFSNNSQGGLVVRTYGAITLSSVTANNNAGGYGADLRNCLLDDSNEDPSLWTCTGSYIPKAVVLNGVNRFNENISGGLRILTRGAITLSNITADTNKVDANNAGGIGVYLNNTYGSSALPQNVTILGSGHFDGNTSGGIKVLTKGAITLNNITADNSADRIGADLDNHAFGSSESPQRVIINGTNSFSGNGIGLQIYTYGAILINNLTANDNNRSYAVILNNQGSLTPQPVTLTGYGTFKRSVHALNIYSKGAITLSNINATAGAGGTGVELNNVNPSAPQPVTLNGSTSISSFSQYGLKITSSGVIKANNLSLSNNRMGGALIQNNTLGMGVTLTGENNSFTGSIYGAGLKIQSLGPISVSNLYVTGNMYDANVILDNSGGIGGVTLSGTNRVGYSTSKGDGIRIKTKGVVLLNNLNVYSNYGYGILIDNTFSGMGTPQNVTLTGYVNIGQNGRGLDGLHITTYGTIAINNLYASCNGSFAVSSGCFGASGNGVWLDNCGFDGITCTSTGAPRGVTITGYANVENNGGNGLWVTSLGPITITNLDAEGNGGNGAYLNNQWTNAVGGITLNGVNTFQCNGNISGCNIGSDVNDKPNSNGLLAYSKGAITLSNVSATSNMNNGVSLDNRGSTGKVVTFTGVNTFSNNGNTKGTEPAGSGLVILSESQITLSNVTASENKVDGINLDNRTNLPTKPGVTLTGLNTFDKNGAKGIYLYTNGIIDLANITTEFNGSDGLYAEATKNITLSCGRLNNNGGAGYNLTTGGLLTLKEVFAFGNVLENQMNHPDDLKFAPVIKRSCYVPPVVVVKPVRKKPAQPDWDKLFPVKP